MGDTLSKIYDYYADYLILCKKHGIEPLELRATSNWYKHFLELDELERKDNE